MKIASFNLDCLCRLIKMALLEYLQANPKTATSETILDALTLIDAVNQGEEIEVE